MPLTPSQLAALKTEIALSAYNGLDDEAIARKLSDEKSRTIDIAILDTGLFVASIVAADFNALTAVQRAHLQLICSAPTLPMTPNLRTQLAALFGPATATRTNYVAASQRLGSRAEELGFGVVTSSDVADARRLP